MFQYHLFISCIWMYLCVCVCVCACWDLSTKVTQLTLSSPQNASWDFTSFHREGSVGGKMQKNIFCAAFKLFHYFRCFKEQGEAITAEERSTLKCNARQRHNGQKRESMMGRRNSGKMWTGWEFVILVVDYRFLPRVREVFHVLQNAEV